MKLLVPLLALVLMAGCASTRTAAVEQTPEGVVMLSSESLGTTAGEDRILNNLRTSWARHVKDCRVGLAFTHRTLSRDTERCVDRMLWYLK